MNSRQLAKDSEGTGKPLPLKEQLKIESWKETVFSDISVIIDSTAFLRALGISGLESPYLTANLDFSGPCENKCPGCHSKALWNTVESDRITVGEILVKIDYLYSERNIIEGVCILGTDNPERENASRAITRFCEVLGIPSIVYTGYDICQALEYGRPSFFVCGTYINREWHSNKRFYRLDQGSYDEISIHEYFRRSI